MLLKSISRNSLSASIRCLSQYTVRSPYPDTISNNELLKKSFPEFLMSHHLNPNIRNNVAIVDGSNGNSITFGDLYTRTYKFAHFLKFNVGVHHGDRVAIMSPNNIDFSTAFNGIAITGACSTLINPLYTSHEIEYQLEITNAKIIIVHPACMDRVFPIAKARGIVMITLGETDGVAKGINDIISSVSEYDTKLFGKVSPNDILTIPFSSGTTGKPKGVVLSHRNVAANILQMMPVEGDFYGDYGVPIVPLPFFHIFGLVAGLHIPAYLGKKMVFLPAFDLVKFLELIPQHKVTRAYVVPPIILALAKHPLVDKYDLSSLKVILSGAAPLGSDVQEACSTRLNCIVKQAWGMTELSPAGTYFS